MIAPLPVAAFLLPLDGTPEEIEACLELLDAEERARVEKFRLARDRDRFIVRRAAVRRLLAGVLDRPTAALRLERSAHGKPLVADVDGLSFSVSSSAGMALCVITRDAAIGCDIAWRDPALAEPDIARRLFAPGEWRRLQALAPEDFVAGFYRCWTRKEAFVKATGDGLLLPLDRFEVSVDGDRPAGFLAGGEGWSMAAWEPLPGFEAAVVARAPAIRVTTAAWEVDLPRPPGDGLP
jgi:4'-phosphopantetheinyl transferase